MTATTATPRRAIVIGTKEVTFTPYVIRKVGEVRSVTIDGVVQSVIYNERRNLTYLVLDGVTGRIADELEADGSYGSVEKAKRAAPPAGKRSLLPLAEKAVAGDKAAIKELVDVISATPLHVTDLTGDEPVSYVIPPRKVRKAPKAAA